MYFASTAPRKKHSNLIPFGFDDFKRRETDEGMTRAPQNQN